MVTVTWWMLVTKWVADVFGGQITAVAIDRISSRLKSIFATRNILILGDSQTGKTSLINYLSIGKPYEVRKGEIVPPDKTSGYIIVDKKIKLDERKLKVKYDVAGENDLVTRSIWKMVLTTLKPAGLIYMLDGRLDGVTLENAIDVIFDEILVVYEERKLGGLEALHVFVNFSDIWATSPVVERQKSREIEEMFDERLDKYKNLQNLRVGVSATQLSTNKVAWIELERALFSFGADLLK